MSWGFRYLSRLLERNLGRSLLSLLLAALLAFAVGLLTVLRGVYEKAYQNVDVRAVFYGGLPYTSAQKIEKSGMVKDPVFEYVYRDAYVDYHTGALYFTNNLSRIAQAGVEWMQDWNEELFCAAKEKICILPYRYAEEMGKGLGDYLRVEEREYLEYLRLQLGLTETEEQLFKALAIRDQHRPQLQIVGLIRSEGYDNTLYIPITAWQYFSWISSRLILDLADFSLIDYHQTKEFSAYAAEVLSQIDHIVKLDMDTSYADRIYSIHRLIETLYPLTIAAALLLGGILPGLAVLHASKEISILRALGTKVRKCVGLYVLVQVLCALVGLFLGLALVLALQKPELSAVTRPFVLYFATHLAACAVGSSVFAWLCARKRVLEQLQAKE